MCIHNSQSTSTPPHFYYFFFDFGSHLCTPTNVKFIHRFTMGKKKSGCKKHSSSCNKCKQNNNQGIQSIVLEQDNEPNSGFSNNPISSADASNIISQDQNQVATNVPPAPGPAAARRSPRMGRMAKVPTADGLSAQDIRHLLTKTYDTAQSYGLPQKKKGDCGCSGGSKKKKCPKQPKKSCCSSSSKKASSCVKTYSHDSSRVCSKNNKVNINVAIIEKRDRNSERQYAPSTSTADASPVVSADQTQTVNQNFGDDDIIDDEVDE
jgi:hypothetical protein